MSIIKKIKENKEKIVWTAGLVTSVSTVIPMAAVATGFIVGFSGKSKLLPYALMPGAVGAAWAVEKAVDEATEDCVGSMIDALPDREKKIVIKAECK